MSAPASTRSPLLAWQRISDHQYRIYFPSSPAHRFQSAAYVMLWKGAIEGWYWAPVDAEHPEWAWSWVCVPGPLETYEAAMLAVEDAASAAGVILPSGAP